MKHFKKYRAIYITLSAICFIVIICIVGIASSSHTQVAYQWGQLEQQHQENTDKGEPVIEANHFTIYSDDITFLTEKLSLNHMENASDIAAETLVEKYALFYQAQEAGLVLSDSQVDAIIQEQIQIFSDAEADNEDYTAFLNGLGMSNEEYWNSQRDELKISESIAAWKNQQYETYVLSHGPNVDQQEWDKYYNELKSSIIEKENVHYLNSLS